MGLIKNLWRSESASERVGTVIQWVGWKLFHHFVYRPAKHAYAIAHRVYRVLRYVYLILAWGYTKYEARAKVDKEEEEVEEKVQKRDAEEKRAEKEIDRKLNSALNEDDEKAYRKMEDEGTKKAERKAETTTKNGNTTNEGVLKHRGNVRAENEPTFAPLRDL